MTNLRIIFSNPWWLLLLIPAVGLTLLTYFRMNKRYRRTRNHITSIVLHLVIMVLSISVLAGMIFAYNIPNNDNEIILLVDASYSTSDSDAEVDEFIQEVIASSDSMFKLGIVTFGYDQVYAAELTNDFNKVYTDYLTAPLPDISATNIAGALTYASTLFKNPESAKIVLISDAIETDNAAANVIKAVSAQGIMVDTVYFPGDPAENEVQLVSLADVEEKIVVGQKFNLDLTLKSTFVGAGKLTVYDNGVAGKPINVNIREGEMTVSVPYSFTLPGMHKISFELAADNDTLVENNTYLSYFYLDIYDKILVLESNEGESQQLCSLLGEELKVTIINIEDEENMPKTLDALRAYDEIILCNISNENLPEGFDKILYSYVHDVGGGLFTVCGNKPDANPNDDEWTANAYTRSDMYGSLYQQMLPVEVINYTPPVAVMIIIDTSGSMYDGSNYEDSKLKHAQDGAKACLDALTERDFVGVMTLNSNFSEEIELTPRTQREKILSAISMLSEKEENLYGGTLFSKAFERAGKALSANTEVERRHIIVVTDGYPDSNDAERYETAMKNNAAAGITMSIVGIGCDGSSADLMKEILVKYAGVTERNFHNVNDAKELGTVMREDLEVPEIKDVNYRPFTPKITTYTPVLNGIEKGDLPKLEGFYGVKTKEGATTVLMGDFTPVYTQWQYGKGYVGTFACDLNGTWSSELIASDVGKLLVNNIVTSLFPSESIRTSDIDAQITGNNYANRLSVFTTLNEGEIIEANIISPSYGDIPQKTQTFVLSANDGYSRLDFSVTTPGIHEITVNKKNADGNVLSSTTIYKVLSYSQEYNVFTDPTVALTLAENIAKYGDGAVIETPDEVFDDATKYFDREFDPRILFTIIVIVLFLLDVAARKFKWKWPHEIIKARKAEKAKKSR